MDEVLSYVRALNNGLARLPELPVSVRLIREIHAELMRDVRGGRLPGELRTSQNCIGPPGCTLSTATLVPPPHPALPEALLAERGVLHKPVLCLSRFFKQHRQAYYEYLQAVRDRGA